MRSRIFRSLVCALAALLAVPSSRAEPPAYSFGALPIRPPAVTAEYWNPILNYVFARTGVRLELKATRTGAESNAATQRGAYDFIWGNHQFKPDAVEQGYRVILGSLGDPISGEIVVRADSPITRLSELHGTTVGFPSSAAFVGYLVPIDHLAREGVRVNPVYGGNQEGIMAQLKAERVPAAGVNGKVMAGYAAREGLEYRVLWRSSPYPDFPVSVHPRVPAKVVAAVQSTLAGMAHDKDGAAVLAASTAAVKQKSPFGFKRATQRDYQSYLDFFRDTVVAEGDAQ